MVEAHSITLIISVANGGREWNSCMRATQLYSKHFSVALYKPVQPDKATCFGIIVFLNWTHESYQIPWCA